MQDLKNDAPNRKQMQDIFNCQIGAACTSRSPVEIIAQPVFQTCRPGLKIQALKIGSSKINSSRTLNGLVPNVT